MVASLGIELMTIESHALTTRLLSVGGRKSYIAQERCTGAVVLKRT